MKKKFTPKVWLIACVLLSFATFSSFGQDIHFTQFQGTVLNLNPALAGASECDHCFAAQLRRQWQSVPVDYRTFSGNYDRKFFPKKEDPKGWFGGGLLFNYDIAGDSRLMGIQLGVIGSYIRKLNYKNYLSGGVQIGGTQQSFDLGGLQFGDQWEINKELSPILSGTEESFSNLRVLFGGVSVGGNWAYADPRSRTRANVGVGVHHLNQPTKKFTNDVKTNHDRRVSIYGMGTIHVSSNFDLIAQALYQVQGPHNETVLGGYIRGHIDKDPMEELAIQIGAFYRIDDAIAPAIGVIWKEFEAGFSYDINVSGFKDYTGGRGGPEVYLKYCIKAAPVVKPFCPLCPRRT